MLAPGCHLSYYMHNAHPWDRSVMQTNSEYINDLNPSQYLMMRLHWNQQDEGFPTTPVLLLRRRVDMPARAGWGRVGWVRQGGSPGTAAQPVGIDTIDSQQLGNFTSLAPDTSTLSLLSSSSVSRYPLPSSSPVYSSSSNPSLHSAVLLPKSFVTYMFKHWVHSSTFSTVL